MSKRNPMNERYQNDERTGTTRKSAASAKPKTPAASTVVVKKAGKSPEERKKELKEKAKQEEKERKAFNSKYYKPDTRRYKILRTLWWISLLGAIACTAVTFVFNTELPTEVGTVVMVLAYVFIFAAFFLDFFAIRKERTKYQERMKEIDEKRKKEARLARQAELARKNPNVRKKQKGKQRDLRAVQLDEEPKEKEEPKGLFGGFKFGKKDKQESQES